MAGETPQHPRHALGHGEFPPGSAANLDLLDRIAQRRLEPAHRSHQCLRLLVAADVDDDSAADFRAGRAQPNLADERRAGPGEDRFDDLRRLLDDHLLFFRSGGLADHRRSERQLQLANHLPHFGLGQQFLGVIGAGGIRLGRAGPSQVPQALVRRHLRQQRIFGGRRHAQR